MQGLKKIGNFWEFKFPILGPELMHSDAFDFLSNYHLARNTWISDLERNFRNKNVVFKSTGHSQIKTNKTCRLLLSFQLIEIASSNTELFT